MPGREGKILQKSLHVLRRKSQKLGSVPPGPVSGAVWPGLLECRSSFLHLSSILAPALIHARSQCKFCASLSTCHGSLFRISCLEVLQGREGETACCNSYRVRGEIPAFISVTAGSPAALAWEGPQAANAGWSSSPLQVAAPRRLPLSGSNVPVFQCSSVPRNPKSQGASHFQSLLLGGVITSSPSPRDRTVWSEGVSPPGSCNGRLHPLPFCCPGVSRRRKAVSVRAPGSWPGRPD